MPFGLDSLTGMGGILLNYVKSGFLWTIFGIVAVILIVMVYVYFNRKGKLRYNCLEFVRYGNGKVGVKLMPGGVFKAKKTFFGMIDYGGEYVVRVKDGREIQQAKTSYLHDILGKKGYICIRKPDDPNVLVPINKIEFVNLAALFSIAPSDYRDAAGKILQQNEKETLGGLEKYLPYIMLGMMVFALIINTVIISQMNSRALDKSAEIMKQSCSNQQKTLPSDAP